MASRLDFSQIRSLYVGTSSSTTVDTNNLIVTGLVGVGTTSPSSQLSGTIGISIVNATNASLGLSNGTNHWLNYLSGTTYRIWNNTSSEVVTILLNGNVGIGTTSPSAKLDVYGGALTVRGTQSRISINSNYSGSGDIPAGTLISVDDVTNNNLGIIPSSSGIVGSRVAGIAYNGSAWRSMWEFANTSGSEPNLLLVKTAGNVGIGTTSPSYKLDVSGTARFTGSVLAEADLFVTDFLQVSNIPPSNGNTATSVFRLRAQGQTGGVTRQSLWEFSPVVDSAFGNSALAIYKSYDGGAYAEYIRINSSGNVGIGTTSPGALLQVGSGNNTSDALLRLGVIYDNSRSSRGGITWHDTSNTTGKIYTEYDGTMVSMVFGSLYSSGYNSNQLMIIRGNGNVGIGTTSPSEKLQVAGNGLFENNLFVGNGSASEYFLEIGKGRTGNGFAYIDLIGDATYTDYGLRILRNNSGANTPSSISHRGLGDLSITTEDAAPMVFSTSSAERMRITSAGNVGIGTTAPTVPLQIVNTNATISMTNSTAFAVDTGSRIFLGGKYSSATSNNTSAFAWLIGAKENATDGNQAGYLSFTTTENGGGFAERMRITSTGNVGIGTTTPSNRLQVSGSGRVFNAVSSNDQVVGSLTCTTGGVSTLGFNGVGSTSDYHVRIGANTTNLVLYTNDTEKMRITSAGNVGIGTTAPQKLLHINGGSGSVDNLVLESAYVASGQGVAMQFNRGGGVLSRIRGIEEGAWNGGLLFEVRNGASSNPGYDGATNIAMKIATNGNVGIGTTAPAQKLHVDGAIRLTSNPSVTGDGSSAQFWNGSGVGPIIAGSNFQVRTNGNTVAMHVNSSQNVGIGTTTPSYKLDIVGDARITSGSLGVGVAPNATDGRIDASNDIVAYQTSDQRLKENVTQIENALEKVKSLTGVEFDWIEEHKHIHGYEGHDTGIIAQQVQAVMPTAVRTNDTGYLSVRYEKLIGLLIEANKELAARVEELESKLK
jgi:hypothetical protein